MRRLDIEKLNSGGSGVSGSPIADHYLESVLERTIILLLLLYVCYNCRTHMSEYVTIERHAIKSMYNTKLNKITIK